ncbi:NADH dehydrogenase subunit 4L (mitochondrion) [Pyxicephalus adspersus]|uniref:NADH-ubiquinone oxidoreductase chain 4L n=1 Tax=Pyxicephalus adspersus TaxID=30357 RepID=A0A5B8GYD6_PYXAD|nr:NADH dehydrogenase subunit 4L [Pyxicephalus adspersus]QDW76106.1 NADH dehydrogenase subunit 4L [Pyxicephalus adspersus]
MPMLFIIFFTTVFLGLAFHRMHLLSALLCLEGMMLTIFLSLSLWPLSLNLTSPFMSPLLMLTLSACEAALGLSLMVATARSHGTDNLKTLNLLQC